MSLRNDLRNSVERTRAIGDRLMGEQAARAEGDRGRSSRYNDWLESLYTDLHDRGGYSADEERDIIGRDRLDDIATGANYGDWFYNDSEQAGMYGDPNSRYRYMGQWDVDVARNNNSLNTRRGMVSRLRDDYAASITPDLGLSSNFYSDTDAALGKSDAEASAALSDRMRLDPEFAAKYKLSPEDRRRIEVVGAQVVGAGAAADASAAERAAAATGSGPLGVAAVRARARRLSAADAADALTRGRLSASSEEAARLKDIETMRLGTEGRIGELRSNLALAKGDRRLAHLTGTERLRLGAAQDISNRRMDTARDAARLDLDTETQGNREAADASQFYVTQGTRIATDIDRDYRDTAARIANQRTVASRDRDTDRRDRSMYRDAQLTARIGATADARRDDRREARGFLSGSRDLYNTNAQRESDREINTYGTQGNLVNQGNDTRFRESSRPSMWERIAGVAIGGANAAAGFRRK